MYCVRYTTEARNDCHLGQLGIFLKESRPATIIGSKGAIQSREWPHWWHAVGTRPYRAAQSDGRVEAQTHVK